MFGFGLASVLGLGSQSGRTTDENQYAAQALFIPCSHRRVERGCPTQNGQPALTRVGTTPYRTVLSGSDDSRLVLFRRCLRGLPSDAYPTAGRISVGWHSSGHARRGVVSARCCRHTSSLSTSKPPLVRPLLLIVSHRVRSL